MKKTLILLLLAGTAGIAFAQTSADTIEIKRTAFGTVFRSNGKTLRPRQLLHLTQPNPEAHRYMQKAKTNYDLSFVLSFAGGFLVGYPLGTAIAGGDANWTLAGIGAGLIVVSVPFTVGYTKNAKEAARLYNAGLPKTGFRERELYFRIDANGVGVRLGF
ncbi:MAG: hypothetical protein IPH12_02340 [Saprospirales bacterium]|nr:hypothetical protein [Saprospirales bacterium]MBK8921514.1 hypothetical protein [Saprospirales bacterium]